MSFHLKYIMISISCISASMFSGCYTSFMTLHALPAMHTGYVIEEIDEDETIEVVVYDDWYDYVPIHRPQWVYEPYYSDPIVNVCVRWPNRYWFSYYDPWWNGLCYSTYWSISWHPHRWAAYRWYPVWHPRPARPIRWYARQSHGGWHDYHPTHYFPGHDSRRPFGHSDAVRSHQDHRTTVVSRSSTRRRPVVQSQSRAASGSRLNKSKPAGRPVQLDRDDSPDTRKRSVHTARVMQNQNARTSISNPDRRSSAVRSRVSISRSVPSRSSNTVRIPNQRSERASKISGASDSHSKVTGQSSRKVKESHSSRQSLSKPDSDENSRLEKLKRTRNRVPSGLSKRSAVKSTHSEPSRESSLKTTRSSRASKRSVSNSRSKSTSSVRSALSHSKRSDSGVRNMQSSSRSGIRSSSSKKSSDAGSPSSKRRRR